MKHESKKPARSKSAPPPPKQKPTVPDVWNMTGVLPDPVEIARNRPPGKHRATGVKPTSKELRSRYRVVIELLGRLPKMQIHDFCRTAWDVCWKTADNYVARAREMMLEACDTTKPEMRAQAYHFYDSVLNDPTASHFEKLRARQRIDDLFGLNAPQQHRVEASGPGGGPIKQEISGANVMLYIPDNGRYNPDPSKKHAKDPNERAAAPPATDPAAAPEAETRAA